MAERTFDEFAKPVAIAYIGNKEFKKDTIARTGVVLSGFGDIQYVDGRAAGQLLRFKDVFVKGEQLDEVKKKLKKSAFEEAEKAEREALEAAERAAAAKADAQKLLDEDGGDDATDDLKDVITNAILSLNSDNEEHFTENGKPKIAAVRAAIGENCPEFGAKELNAVFDSLNG